MPITDAHHAAWLARIAAADAVPKVFAVGCAKSGTTWLQIVLNTHPRIVMGGEGSFIWRLAPSMQRALAAFNAEQARLGQPAATFVSDVDFAMTTRLMINTRLAAYAAADGRELGGLAYLGDKTPQHTLGIGTLAELFPTARFVNIVRDPRDAAASAWHHFGKSSGRDLDAHTRWFIGEAWAQAVTAAAGYGDRLPGRVFHVRYEDLHAEPERTLAGVLGFLGVAADEASIGACLAKGRFERLSGGRARGEQDNAHFFRKGVVGDWVNTLPREAVAGACDAVAGLMSRFGYAGDAVAAA